MGRFNHENVAYMADANSRVAFYMGDDSTPGCIYKFVADRAFNESNRAANVDLLDYGTLFVARFNADRSEEPTSELQSLMRISYAVFCLKKKTTNKKTYSTKDPTTTPYR